MCMKLDKERFYRVTKKKTTKTLKIDAQWKTWRIEMNDIDLYW